MTIAHIVASIRGQSVEKVASAAYDNTMRLFFPDEVKDLKNAQLW